MDPAPLPRADACDLLDHTAPAIASSALTLPGPLSVDAAFTATDPSAPVLPTFPTLFHRGRPPRSP